MKAVFLSMSKYKRLSVLLSACGLLGYGAMSHSQAAVIPFPVGGSPLFLNINATTSGITLPNGQFMGSTLVSPLQASFPAGTYTGTVISNLLDPVDAQYTAWSYNVNTPLTPTFLENFEGFADNGGAPNTFAPLVDYRNTAPPYITAALAFADTIGRTFTFTLTAPTIVDFVVPDNILSDNGGGVSVSISRVAVPEPVSTSMIGAGIVPLLLRRRRRAL